MGLDQLRLLRSQHKMARLLLVAALCLASVKAAVIPVEEIVDNLQSFLTAPEESGLRLKRSTGEWDKEFDLSSMGILFQLKYNNPANPFEGGRAHVKVQVPSSSRSSCSWLTGPRRDPSFSTGRWRAVCGRPRSPLTTTTCCPSPSWTFLLSLTGKPSCTCSSTSRRTTSGS